MKPIEITTIAWNKYYWRAYDYRVSNDPEEWPLVASGREDTRLGAKEAAAEVLRELIPEEERDF